MDEWEFRPTWKNILIFIAALGAGAISSGVFHSPFIGLFIILGACWYLAKKRS